MSVTDRRAIFVGCAKNCQNHLPGVLGNIERIASLFGEAAFVFVENDSTDSTKAIFQSWARGKKGFDLLNLDGLDAIQQRGLRLEVARNTYLEYIRSNTRLAGFDYLVVLDLDEINTMAVNLMHVENAVSFLEEKPDSAGVFANQIGVYYDMWTLRHPVLCPQDIWEEVFDYSFKNDVSDEAAYNETFKRRLFSLSPDAGPVEVDSAFGGFGIYKLNYALKNKNPYLGSKVKVLQNSAQRKIARWQVCEHVHFNLGIRNLGGRLFIFPQLVNANTERSYFPPSSWREYLF
jgi:glycosyltransferase involved in cell wall biosynthesis